MLTINMKKTLLTTAFFTTAMFFGATQTTMAQKSANFEPARDIIINERVITTLPDGSQKVVTDNPQAEQVAENKGVGDFIVLPTPVKLDEFATLSFWIEKDGDFTLEIEDVNGSVIEMQKLGKLGSGVHQLAIELSDLKQGGSYAAVLRSEEAFGRAKFSIAP